MFQTEFLVWLTSLQNPVTNVFAKIFTFMGIEEFYLLILPLIYWCFSKKAGFRLFYVFIFSMYINLFLKINVAAPRPVGVEGIHSIFVESAQDHNYPNNSFPSGHAQGSATLWGYLSYLVNRPIFWIFSIFLILMISISRLYTGLHWPIDVLGGIFIGIFTIMVAIRLESYLKRMSTRIQVALAILFPFLLLLIFPEGDKLAGLLLGAGVGYFIEGKVVRFNVQTIIWKKSIAFVLGLIGAVILKLGAKVLLPESHFISHIILGFWFILIAPWLFVKLGLYNTDHSFTENPKPPISM
jgi:membrane-associated phospholipid phosphatase